MFQKPVSRAPSKRKSVGGDDGVERDAMGRPRIILNCEHCSGTGQVPSAKVEGRLNKCQKCKSEGKVVRSYTRMTTFIDTVDDRSNLEKYQQRMVLIGVARDPSFLDGILQMDPEDRDNKDILNRRAEAAQELAGGNDKSEEGTLMHEYSELVDQDKPLPFDIDPDHFTTLEAYSKATRPILDIRHIEQLVVNDDYKVAGTPDRVSTPRQPEGLVAPDGEIILPGTLLITDLKTGRVDYGGLKMSMQLAGYAHSMLYDKTTGARVPLGNINQRWGLIMHAPPKGGKCDLLWADLTLGWECFELSARIRAARSAGRKALIPLSAAA